MSAETTGAAHTVGAVEDRLAEVTARYDDEDGEAARLLEQALARLAWRKRRGGKECSACGETRPVSEFGPDGSRRDGLAHRCRACDAGRGRDRRASPNSGPLLL